MITARLCRLEGISLEMSPHAATGRTLDLALTCAFQSRQFCAACAKEKEKNFEQGRLLQESNRVWTGHQTQAVALLEHAWSPSSKLVAILRPVLCTT